MLKIKTAILFHSTMHLLVYHLISVLSVVFMLGFMEELSDLEELGYKVPENEIDLNIITEG